MNLKTQEVLINNENQNKEYVNNKRKCSPAETDAVPCKKVDYNDERRVDVVEDVKESLIFENVSVPIENVDNNLEKVALGSDTKSADRKNEAEIEGTISEFRTIVKKCKNGKETVSTTKTSRPADFYCSCFLCAQQQQAMEKEDEGERRRVKEEGERRRVKREPGGQDNVVNVVASIDLTLEDELEPLQQQHLLEMQQQLLQQLQQQIIQLQQQQLQQQQQQQQQQSMQLQEQLAGINLVDEPMGVKDNEEEYRLLSEEL
ncbi:uncharacterized protein [Musca autumnalis]|uniref:uncharacterized protein n=1 Tax=Musca autumnalis TaxID=221902 RepID=UPI003CE6AD48